MSQIVTYGFKSLRNRTLDLHFMQVRKNELSGKNYWFKFGTKIKYNWATSITFSNP